MKKNTLYIVLTLIVAGIFLILGVRHQLREQLFPVATVQSMASFTDEDYDIALKGINVPNANLKDFKGKVLFLNFWGTWCPPCREEWPTIQKFYETKGSKVSVVLIAMQDEEAAVKKFLETHRYTAPVYIADSPIAQNLLPKVFPTTYLVAPGGQILRKETKSIRWDTPEVYQFVEKIRP